MKTIAIDAMGGDYGPQVVVPAALRVLRNHPDVYFIFVGQETLLKPMLEQRAKDLVDRIKIQHAPEVVAMDESPSQALRMKKNSSMRIAINLVKEGQAQACVSAGNTGALMATAHFVLKPLPGIDRPAIITSFPTRIHNKSVWLLDVGANVDSKAKHLFQFAVMGAILAGAETNIERPAVGLLNIGEEEIKGNEQVKQTAELLSHTDAVNYIGYVEGDAMFSGQVDVVVADGFVGNITLKTIEGAAKLIGRYMREAFMQNWLTKLAAIPALPVLNRLKKRIDPRHRNGASLIGLNGIVIKSHGSAGVVAFSAALEEAILEVERNIPGRIRKEIARYLQEQESA